MKKCQGVLQPKYFQGVSKLKKKLPRSTIIKNIQEIPQTKVFPRSVTLKILPRTIIIKAAAMKCQNLIGGQGVHQSKECQEVIQSKGCI